MSTLIGRYVTTFAEASHAMPIGMHMNADYPFKLPAIVSLSSTTVELEGTAGKRVSAKVQRDSRGEYCVIKQSSSFEAMTGRRPSRFRCEPFKDNNTSAIDPEEHAP